MHLSADISAVRIKKSNLCSDAQLNVEKAAEVVGAYLWGQLTGKTVQICLHTSY